MTSSIEQEKERMRKIFKRRRSSLSQVEVKINSDKISNNFINNLLPRIYSQNAESHKIFSLYLPIENEVDTGLIADYFSNHQINFSYPRISQKNHHLDFILATKNQEFVPNIFYPKVLEPRGGKMFLPDIIILPLLAFDSSLTRLGMGGGFFDRTIEFLKTQKSQIITIGLGYDIQRADEILVSENTDQNLDFIVTEKNIFSRS